MSPSSTFLYIKIHFDYFKTFYFLHVCMSHLWYTVSENEQDTQSTNLMYRRDTRNMNLMYRRDTQDTNLVYRRDTRNTNLVYRRDTPSNPWWTGSP